MALLSCVSSLLNQTQTNTVKIHEIDARVKKIEEEMSAAEDRGFKTYVEGGDVGG